MKTVTFSTLTMHFNTIYFFFFFLFELFGSSILQVSYLIKMPEYCTTTKGCRKKRRIRHISDSVCPGRRLSSEFDNSCIKKKLKIGQIAKPGLPFHDVGIQMKRRRTQIRSGSKPMISPSRFQKGTSANSRPVYEKAYNSPTVRTDPSMSYIFHCIPIISLYIFMKFHEVS